MTEEEFISELKSMKAEGKSSKAILNALAAMFVDDRIGMAQISEGADFLGFEFGQDGLSMLQENAKSCHPDYPAYVKQLMEEAKKKGQGTADSLAGYLINALEAGFITDKEANLILADEGMLYRNHSFFLKSDPILAEVDAEVQQKRNEGMSDDDIMEAALKDYRKGRIAYSRFALIISACGHNFSDSYLRLDERKQKKAKLRDMLV
jgi:hypothetical protein